MRVLVFGTFDGLHPGHRFFIAQALQRALGSSGRSSQRASAIANGEISGAGDAVKRAVPEGRYERGELYVVVARDENVKRFKGRLPEHPADARRRAVQEMFPEAHVYVGEVDDYFLPVLTVKPDLLLLGYDQKLPPGVEIADFAEAGIEVERVKPYRPQMYKSSLLREEKK